MVKLHGLWCGMLDEIMTFPSGLKFDEEKSMEENASKNEVV